MHREPPPTRSHPSPPSCAAAGGDPGDDAALVAAVRRGDRDAFDRLARRHVGMLVATARRLLGDLGDAEEAAADALVRAHEAIGRLGKPAQFGAWAHRIVVRAALDRLRRRRRTSAREALGDGGVASAVDLRSVGRGPTTPLVEREAVERVREAVDALPETQRVALLLHAWEGLAYPEIATLLGLTYDAVRVAVGHARRRLRRRVGDLLGGGP